jgi:hypothetical protein
MAKNVQYKIEKNFMNIQKQHLETPGNGSPVLASMNQTNAFSSNWSNALAQTSPDFNFAPFSSTYSPSRLMSTHFPHGG